MAEQPHGTVTFLFTDIEQSTRLLTDPGAETYGRALEEHRSRLRAAFHAGYEVDAAGVAGFYGDLLDGIVCDEEPPAAGPEGLRTDTRMDDAAARAGLAERTLAFAASLAAG